MSAAAPALGPAPRHGSAAAAAAAAAAAGGYGAEFDGGAGSEIVRGRSFGSDGDGTEASPVAAARARERAVTLPVLAVCVWAAEEGAHVAKREQQRRRDEEALLVAQARAAERAVSALLPPFIAAARAGAFHLTLHRSMEQASADAPGRSVGGSGGVAAREAAAAAAAAAAAE
ncbi:MAG: hypothetical protein ACK4ZJ_19520, partial [Allorhizobium sp.]